MSESVEGQQRNPLQWRVPVHFRTAVSDSLGVAVQYVATGHKLKSSFNQMETPTHFSLNCTHGAIRKPPFCLSVQGHSN